MKLSTFIALQVLLLLYIVTTCVITCY